MASVVIYDACVLYPAPLRDLLIRIGQAGLVRARWSHQILEECFRNISAKRPELDIAALARTKDLMTRAVPDCMVDGYAELIDGLSLPDPNDRHVLAAAIRADARTIVTFNLRDFPAHTLEAYAVESVHPDDFVSDLVDLAPGRILEVLDDQVAPLKSPPLSVADLLGILENCGLMRSVARLRELVAP